MVKSEPDPTEINSVEVVLGRLPSIRVLIVSTCMMLAVPLVWIGYDSWTAAQSRVSAAQEATESAHRLESLLRLAPALHAERMSASASAGTADFVVGLPPGALGFLGLDFVSAVDDDREVVDRLLAANGDAELESEVRSLRAAAAADELTVYDLLDGYDQLAADIAASIDDELGALTAAAASAGDDEIATAARVAEAAAGLQLAMAGQDLQWVQLEARAFTGPSVDDVNQFAASVTLLEYQIDEFDRIVPRGSALGREWEALQQLEATTIRRERHAATVTELAISGIAPSGDGMTEIDLSSADFDELMGVASELVVGLEASQEVSAGLSSVVEASLAEVLTAADRAVGEARADRDRTAIGIAASLGFFGAAAAALVILIARPVRRMGEVADDLTIGELNARIDERGPKEIRVGARAMNEALATLRAAEAQADALAEERLDDPALANPAPGRLGSSLQAAVSRLAASMVEREEFQQRLAHEASHDGLTKLANRKAVLKQLGSGLARTRRSSASLALLFLDVDDFKSTNDNHGHHVGDLMLRTIAQRLVGSIREGDVAGRLGGDEFVVIAEPVRDIDEALGLSRRIIDKVAQPMTVDGVTLTPSVSIGIGLANDELTADELLFDADLAVYRAKSMGKGRVEVCDESLREEVQSRTRLEDALRSAIANDELVLHYQSTVDAASGTVTSLEALVRWNRDGATMIPPDKFIPIAERSDLIVEIDRWVLAAAARQLAAWTNHETLGAIPIAVNISGRHLGSGELFRDVHDALEYRGVEPGRLILEVTESALLEDLATAAHELGQLRRLGVRVALDDFGTGYMSLAHLRGLPVDVLKIDRSFINELDTNAEHALVQLIVDTGHLLGVAVTAEGVETTAQAETVTEMGSDFLQGYLYSEPQDATSTERAFQQHRGDCRRSLAATSGADTAPA